MRCDLSKTEMEIMQLLWERGGVVASGGILDYFYARGKSWKRQTLNTLLNRMVDKGVIVRKRGSVRALCSLAEYRHQQSRTVLEESFEGRLELFVAAYLGKADLSPEASRELEELLTRETPQEES